MSIVLGFTPNERGKAALDYAVKTANMLELPLVIVNSSRGDSLVDQSFIQGEQVDRLHQFLEERLLPGSYTLAQPVQGRDAAEEVLAVAAEHNALMIIIGIRRRSPVGKLIMGSTAQRILLEAECPVLAVKADMKSPDAIVALKKT